ncbi:hypothetical protein O0L34_g9402 [Tuta absoluta]|nr:hypothetical protein O0L34_g9402 [Tuta absoluta]
MFSLSKLMERLGLTGRLLAFFKAVCVYFAIASGMEDGPSIACAAAKCAPIVCLLIIVLAQRADIPADTQWPDQKERRRYCTYVAIGLVLSAVGDALLVWPQYFVGGMGAFALAHVAYIAAFGWRPLAPLVAMPLFMGVGWYLWVVRATGLLRVLVPVYALVLVTMAWRGAARAQQAHTALWAGLGAALFLLSDAALGYSMFAHPLPHRQTIVMSSYYLAQLGIAWSALEPSRRGAAAKEQVDYAAPLLPEKLPVA